MAAWCPVHNVRLWEELGNTNTLGLASAVAIDRLRADPRFRAALAQYGTPPSRAEVEKVLRDIGPICCFLLLENPHAMEEILAEARQLTVAKPDTAKEEA